MGEIKGWEGYRGTGGGLVVKKKGARRVKCKRPSMVKLCGCFRNIKYSARLPAGGLPGALSSGIFYLVCSRFVNRYGVISSE